METKDLGNNFSVKYDYYDDGTLFSENYYNGKLRGRSCDKPSIINYGIDGKITNKAYCENGVLHRKTHAPAFIMYNDKGNIDRVEYWYEGKMQSKEENELITKLNKRKEILDEL